MSPVSSKFARRLLLLLILLIPLPVLFHVSSPERRTHLDLSRLQPSLVPEPTNGFYLSKEDQGMEYLQGGSRLLGFQEKVFFIREEAGRALVLDRRGRQGWVPSSALKDSFSASIDHPLSGVNYEQTPPKKSIREGDPLRGIYVPSALLEGNRSYLLSSWKEAGINTLVLDYKDEEEQFLLPSAVADRVLGTQPALFEEEVVKDLKDQGFYLIARLQAFLSPRYAARYPEKGILREAGVSLVLDGISWPDPRDREFWHYLRDLSQEALERGFDEVQLSFARFPVLEMDYLNPMEEGERTALLQQFLLFMADSLKAYPQGLSAEIHGWSATARDDLGTGQQWEAMSLALETLSPTFYPSQYGEGTFGLYSPASVPGETVGFMVKDALSRNGNLAMPALLRPWIQDFSWGVNYSDKEVREQIEALKVWGIEDFLLWNPEGQYHLGALQ